MLAQYPSRKCRDQSKDESNDLLAGRPSAEKAPVEAYKVLARESASEPESDDQMSERSAVCLPELALSDDAAGRGWGAEPAEASVWERDCRMFLM